MQHTPGPGFGPVRIFRQPRGALSASPLGSHSLGPRPSGSLLRSPTPPTHWVRDNGPLGPATFSQPLPRAQCPCRPLTSQVFGSPPGGSFWQPSAAELPHQIWTGFFVYPGGGSSRSSGCSAPWLAFVASLCLLARRRLAVCRGQPSPSCWQRPKMGAKSQPGARRWAGPWRPAIMWRAAASALAKREAGPHAVRAPGASPTPA